jgi:tetratricopeptide (TPR) repeat protein
MGNGTIPSYQEIAELIPLFWDEALAKLDLQQAQFAGAREQLDRVLAIFQENGDQEGEAETLRELGVSCLHQEDFSAAYDYSTRALTIRQAIKDPRGEALAFLQLGQLAASQGKPLERLRLWAVGCRILVSVGDGEAEQFVNVFLNAWKDQDTKEEELEDFVSAVAASYDAHRGKQLLAAAFSEF